jgi:hypothetical protein
MATLYAIRKGGASGPQEQRRRLAAMDKREPMPLAEARPALRRAAGRTAALLRTLADLEVRVRRSEWTVRQAGVHLVTGTALYADIATGLRSPVPAFTRETLAADNSARIADIPESDPAILAVLLQQAADRVLLVTANRRGDEIVVWHGGRRISLGHLVCLCLGEHLLHSLDIAVATGRPWTLEPGDVGLVAAAYAAIDEEEFQLESLQGRTSWTSL